jgi:hypothetical protein
MNDQAKTAAESAVARERFNFALAVQDRAYPEIQVPIYLDEAAAREYISLSQQREAIEAKIIKATAQGAGKVAEPLAEEAARLEERIDAIRARLEDSGLVVTVRGISGECVEELRLAAYEAFPVEHEEHVSPITGVTTKTEKPQPKRDEYFATLSRHAHIVKVVAPDGAVDDGFSVDEFAATWVKLPIVARVKLDEAINETVVAVDYYKELVNPVF